MLKYGNVPNFKSNVTQSRPNLDFLMQWLFYNFVFKPYIYILRWLYGII